jgi:hypothetical protein
MTTTRKSFSTESEAARRALFEQVRLGDSTGLFWKDYSFTSFNKVLPMWFPDGFRFLFLPDMHVPAQNRRIMWAVKRFAKWFRPHGGVMIGDGADMFFASAWPKPPRTSVSAQGELDETQEEFRDFLEFMYWMWVIEGNHEDRVIRMLTKLFPALAHIVDPATREPILNVHQMLGFGAKDPITFLKGIDERGGFEGGMLINNDVKLEHGMIVKPLPGASAQAHAEAFDQNTGMGHTHRAGVTARLTFNSVLRSFELGNLVDFDHPYFAYAPMKNWHHAIGVGHVFNGKLHVEVIPIQQGLDEKGVLHYWFVYDGQVFKSSDR